MKKTEIKKLQPGDIETIVNGLADSGLELNAAINQRSSLLSQLDDELAPIKIRYAERLGALDRQIEKLTSNQDQNTDILATWSEIHRDVFFVTKKSIEFLRGTIGFRNSKPAVDTLEGWTQPKAALALLRKKSWGIPFVETKYNLKKNDLIKARDQLGASKLASCGLIIEDVEDFYFEPKTEKADAVIASPII